MRKLKLAILLPFLHILAYLLTFDFHLLPDKEPTTWIRLWLALNAPVLLLLDLSKWAASSLWQPPQILNGIGSFYLIYLVGGLGLWFSVGHAIDKQRREPKPTPKFQMSFGSVMFNLLLISCGVLVAFHGIKNILPDYPGQQRSILTSTNGLMNLTWSHLLIRLATVNAWQISTLRKTGTNGNLSDVSAG